MNKPHAAAVAFGLVFLMAGAFAEPATTTTTVPASSAGTVLGRIVVDSTGAESGLLLDVLVDKNGKPLAGVISIGGFMGVGARRIAVAWRLLHFTPTDTETRVVMDLTMDAAAAAAEINGPDHSAIIVDHAAP